MMQTYLFAHFVLILGMQKKIINIEYYADADIQLYIILLKKKQNQNGIKLESEWYKIIDKNINRGFI